MYCEENFFITRIRIFVKLNPKKIMRKLLSWVVMLLACVAITSCTDNDLPTETVVRDYQTDARILSRFVDVNKTIGEYYINESKKNSPMAYVTNKDWEELQLVSPANRTRYENELKALNAQLAIVAQRSDVDQIVYSTYGNTWIRELKSDSPIAFTKNTQPITKSARNSYGRLTLPYNSEQWQSFYAGNRINMQININLTSYTYYFFEIICETNASKTGSSAGGSNPKTVVMSGTTMMEQWQFTWTENTGSSNVYWEFRGMKHAPTDIGSQIVAEFTD